MKRFRTERQRFVFIERHLKIGSGERQNELSFDLTIQLGLHIQGGAINCELLFAGCRRHHWGAVMGNALQKPMGGSQRWAPALISSFRAREREAKKRARKGEEKSLSCPACSVLPVLFCLSCSSSPVLPVLFFVSYSACLSCSVYPVLPVLICLSCSACPVSPVLFCLPVLFCMSCSACHVSACPVLIVLSWLSCPGFPVMVVLVCQSRSGYPILAVMFWLAFLSW